MVELDQQTRDMIIETHTNVKNIFDDLVELKDTAEKMKADYKERYYNLESRLRRVENLFLPIIAIISIFGSKIFEWFSRGH